MNVEGAPFPQLALDRNEPAVLCDDPVDGAQAKASPFACRVGCEKGFEEMSHRRGRHAATGIGNG